MSVCESGEAKILKLRNPRLIGWYLLGMVYLSCRVLQGGWLCFQIWQNCGNPSIWSTRNFETSTMLKYFYSHPVYGVWKQKPFACHVLVYSILRHSAACLLVLVRVDFASILRHSTARALVLVRVDFTSLSQLRHAYTWKSCI